MKTMARKLLKLLIACRKYNLIIRISKHETKIIFFSRNGSQFSRILINSKTNNISGFFFFFELKNNNNCEWRN